MVRILSVLTIWLWSVAASALEGYRIGPSDRLRIEVLDQAQLSREFMVQADGSVRLPRVGTVAFDGLTLGEAQVLLTHRIASSMGLARPDVTIEIVTYRPVYVTGHVQTPGAHAYAPGMTVMSLIALAGGYRRSNADDSVSRLEVGRLLERLGQLQDQLAASHVRLARLQAERDGREQIVRVPDLQQLVPEQRISDLYTLETTLLDVRRQTLSEALSNAANQRAELNRELDSLQSRRTGKNAQIVILQREITMFRGLQERNLSPVTRVFELDRAMIGYEGDLREIDATVARARREAALVEQRELSLKADRQLEIANGIKEMADAVAQQWASILSLEAQINTARGLTAATGAAVDPSGVAFEKLMVLRRGAEHFVQIGLIDNVRPDDVLAIPTPPPSRNARRLD
ncbi:hypothetical protein IP69_18335 [Bosea sp. AAP35]|uniref:polysaccharide biosynthesis/export family protein n=1 Tax=Bosea sp. AAP35 TaxID=1523417 RepID=UPI0006B8D665|nr:polysaccharide biosynthesis/export family protein [Bosea sp. AAP35]KPF64337.1 hypothetical protein IP69_18335 [Bosea sp. AAP35]